MNPDVVIPERIEPPKPKKRLRRSIALAIAAASDLVQVMFLPLFGEGFASPAEDVLDVMTAATLVAVLGFQWRLVAAFAMELVPGATLFPSWTAAVLSLPQDAEPPEHASVTRVPQLQRP